MTKSKLEMELPVKRLFPLAGRFVKIVYDDRGVYLPEELGRTFQLRQKAKSVSDCAVYIQNVDGAVDILTDMPPEELLEQFRLIVLDEKGKFVLPEKYKEKEATFIGRGKYVEVYDGARKPK